MCYDFSPDNVEVIFEDESYCKFNCSDELVREVDNAILKLMSVVDFKHVQHLGLLEPQT